MARDKTAVERGLTKQEPIGHSKTSLNRDSAHCSRSSNENEEQQRNSIHIKFLEKRGSGNISLGYITGNEIGHDRTV